MHTSFKRHWKNRRANLRSFSFWGYTPARKNRTRQKYAKKFYRYPEKTGTCGTQKNRKQIGIRLEKTDTHGTWKKSKGMGKRLEKTPSPLIREKNLRIHPGKNASRPDGLKNFWDTPWKNRPAPGRGTAFWG